MNATATLNPTDAPELFGPPRKWMGEIRHHMGGKKGQRFDNNGSYESVESTLTRLAIRCHARAVKLELALAYEDVRQEMDESYIRCFRAWNPERGVKFNSYLTTACLNNFNARIEKMVEERANLGMYSYDNRTADVEENEAGDALERLNGIEDETDSPEARIMARQAIRERLKGLSHSTQRFVTALLMAETVPGRNMVNGAARFSSIARQAGITGEELRRVKVEITQKFGFEW